MDGSIDRDQTKDGGNVVRSTNRLVVSPLISAFLIALAGASFLLADFQPLFTITEDIDPQNTAVLVTVGNSSEKPASGYVEVIAYWNGIPTRRGEPVTVTGYGTEVVTVYYGSGVSEIIQTAIIEDPDPIPC
jgi:hypothetical protein